jgi:probable DNA metabolism protein
MIYLTNGSYEGLLCAVFASYTVPAGETLVQPSQILDRERYQIGLLDSVRDITCEELIATRVLAGIEKIAGASANRLLLKVFLSEFTDAPMLVYRLIKKLMRLKNPAFLKNYADADVLRAAQISKMINREVHRMHAFVRFQKLHSGDYLALIDPDFDVMPLLDDHFVRRFADMTWTIFDTRRGYGIYFDKTTVTYVRNIPADLDESERIANQYLDDKEKAFQALWKAYFDSVNINARKNEKHHIAQLPKRYWKYLPEKQSIELDKAAAINLLFLLI